MSLSPLIKVLQNNLKRALRCAALEEAKPVLDRLREEDVLVRDAWLGAGLIAADAWRL